MATDGTAVLFGNGGTVTNAAGDAIDGTSGGVVIISTAGTLIDNGQIVATVGSGAELSVGGTVTIASGATIQGGAYGVWMPSGSGSVTNDGVVTGKGDDGIEVGGAGAVVTNDGTVSGETGVVLGGTGDTLIASGEIVGTGGTAVVLGSGDTLVDAGASFVGKVVDPTSDGTLELADGTSGALGLGGALSGFDNLQVDSGADWSVPDDSDLSDLIVNGILTVASGVDLTDATLSGDASSGDVQLSTSAVFDVGDALDAPAITFMGGSTLDIDHAAQFGINVGSTAYDGPMLKGFAAGDYVDLKDLVPTGLSLSHTSGSQLLNIHAGSTVKATLLFQPGALGSVALQLKPDGHGGTLLYAS